MDRLRNTKRAGVPRLPAWTTSRKNPKHSKLGVAWQIARIGQRSNRAASTTWATSTLRHCSRAALRKLVRIVQAAGGENGARTASL